MEKFMKIEINFHSAVVHLDLFGIAKAKTTTETSFANIGSPNLTIMNGNVWNLDIHHNLNFVNNHKYILSHTYSLTISETFVILFENIHFR